MTWILPLQPRRGEGDKHTPMGAGVFRKALRILSGASKLLASNVQVRKLGVSQNGISGFCRDTLIQNEEDGNIDLSFEDGASFKLSALNRQLSPGPSCSLFFRTHPVFFPRQLVPSTERQRQSSSARPPSISHSRHSSYLASGVVRHRVRCSRADQREMGETPTYTSMPMACIAKANMVATSKPYRIAATVPSGEPSCARTAIHSAGLLPDM